MLFYLLAPCNIMVEIGEDFGPDREYRTLLLIYLLLGLVLLVLWWYLPLALMLPAWEMGIMVLVLVSVIVILAIWIHLYFHSITYRLDQDEIVWKRGVWFRKTGVVPYNRITNVDIHQGPISRMLRLAQLGIQTAGYSVSSEILGQVAENRISGVKEYEKIHEMIMEKVRGRYPMATESGDNADEMVRELRRIRELLERRLL